MEERLPQRLPVLGHALGGRAESRPDASDMPHSRAVSLVIRGVGVVTLLLLPVLTYPGPPWEERVGVFWSFAHTNRAAVENLSAHVVVH